MTSCGSERSRRIIKSFTLWKIHGWNPKMEVRFRWFSLFNWVILRFHVNFQGRKFMDLFHLFGCCEKKITGPKIGKDQSGLDNERDDCHTSKLPNLQPLKFTKAEMSHEIHQFCWLWCSSQKEHYHIWFPLKLDNTLCRLRWCVLSSI